MKAMILAGGLGTRLAEETSVRPKPLVEVGGYPMLWHIMKIYSHHGIKDFIICVGYKGEMIREYFVNYGLQQSDITVDLSEGSVVMHRKRSEDWKITIVETGADSMTGGRVRAAADYLDPGEDFLLTYGDGVGDVDIAKLIAFHKAHGKEATVTAVTPPGRFGVLEIDGENCVRGFREKIASDQYRVNAGFFVLKPEVINRIAGPETVLEKEPLVSLAQDGQLVAYHHDGFWQPMDTLRDKIHLEDLWAEDKAPWAVWAK
jgi:glucose-1-phosphate cytidylyltransferase